MKTRSLFILTLAVMMATGRDRAGGVTVNDRKGGVRFQVFNVQGSEVQNEKILLTRNNGTTI